MTHPRPFRFGAHLNAPFEGATWAESTRRLEALGYDSVQIADHFHDQWGVLACLGAAAEATTTLKLGTLVFANDYRHPAVLAKEVATIDRLSGGRAELGLGAGWSATDYAQTGIPLDRPGIRIERMVESLEIIRGLLGDGPVDFAGQHYEVSGLEGLPKPVQAQIPILIGGGGERMLRTATSHADIVGVTANLRSGEMGADAAADSMAASYDRKLEWVRDEAGARYDEIELNCLAMAAKVTDDPAGAAAFLGELFGVAPDEVVSSPAVILGSTAEIVESLEARRERWDFSYISVMGADAEAFAPVVEQLAGR